MERITIRVLLTVFPVFIAAFLATDYMLTGSVTNTWIAMAVILAAMVTGLRAALREGGR